MSAPVSTTAQPQAQQQQVAAASSNEPFPSPTVLFAAAKLAMKEDKAIQLDYYKDSFLQKAFIAEDKTTKEKILAKSKEEFTSYIKSFYNIPHKVGDKVMQTDHILVTENSIYIVNGTIKKRILDHSIFQPSEYDM
jgi:hypothetical protein